MNTRFLVSLVGSALGCLQSMCSAAQEVPYGNNPAAGRYQMINGIKLYYEVYEAGKPLLLLDGNGGSPSI